MIRELLTAAEVSRRLGVPRSRTYQLARKGLLPVVRLGRQLRWDEAAVEMWIARGGRGLGEGDTKPTR